MSADKINTPILITGAERSGATIVAKAIEMCDVFTGVTTNMNENIAVWGLMTNLLESSPNPELMPASDSLYIPVNWRERVYEMLNKDGYKKGAWMIKSSLLAQLWPVWHYAFPNAKWIIVRRRTGDIIQSCMKTAYMRDKYDWNQLNKTEQQGWLWWVHQYEQKFVEMIESGVNCKVVWPERMVSGDYNQMFETVDWLGLKWNSKIYDVIDPMLEKSRRKENVSTSTSN